MVNHPNRSRRAVARSGNPSPDDIRAAREGAGLTQAQAADLVHATWKRWQEWETGRSRMHPGLWELFRIKTKNPGGT